MHIYEIISEATPVDPATRKARLARAQAARTGTATAEKTATTAGKATAAAAGGTSRTSQINALIKDTITRRNIGGTALETKVAQHLGGYLRIIKFFGFFPIALELWQQKEAIDILVAEKKISAEDGTAAYRMQIEKFAVSIMATSAFASLIRGLAFVPMLRWVVRGAAALATGASLGALGAPAVALALASEAGAIWLQSFLASESGQKALAYWVLYIIDPSVTWLWNMGPGKIFGAWETASAEGREKLSQLPNKDAAGKSTATGTAATGQAAQPATGQAAQPRTAQMPEPAGGWGTTDPYKDLTLTKDVKAF